MGELVVTMFMSLDGVTQAPGGAREDLDGGFRLGGWQAPYRDEASGAVLGKQLARMDALLLGRRTYEILAPYWQAAPAEHPLRDLFNVTPKYVASRTLDSVGWANSHLISGELPEAVAGLKQGYNEIHVSGSGLLVQTLLQHGLVDRLHLWLHPVLLGSGKKTFAAGTVPAALRLVDSAIFDSGTVLLSYQHVGRPAHGDLARDTADRSM